MNELQKQCGFESGTVPPLGLSPAPILTIVEKSLLIEDDDADDSMLLVGGGGLPNQSTLLPVRTLLDLVPNVQTADFREQTNKPPKEEEEEPSSRVVLSGHHEQEFRLKPFFAVEPPDTNMAEQILTESHDKSLQPEWLTVVGRISGVRQISRRLVFADLAPPPTTYDEAQGEEEDDHPWRSPRTTMGKEEEDMAVQLILGKTICERLGDEDGVKALKRLKVGQLIMVQGRTNVENRRSLKNWIRKKSLDIAVFDYQLLQPQKVINMRKQSLAPKEQSKSTERVCKKTESISNLPFLQLHDLIEDASLEEVVSIVDSRETVATFNEDLSQWLTANPNETGLVGVDCEWKPNFRAVSEAQPVLLLQICFYPLKRIHLLDLQTLLRPLLLPSESLNPLEMAVSKVISELFQTKRLIKVGFQVAHDFQKLAASYPHIKEFQEVHTVLEASKLGMKVMEMTKQPGSRLATSSLSKMTELFIGRILNKEQQVSDWSLRPLINEQIVYASLDAVVTPVIVENLIKSIGAQFFSEPQLGRCENDPAFYKSLISWRFMLLNTTDLKAIRKLRAKRLVGDSFVASQSWVTAEEAPNLPSIPDDGDEPYTDLNGVVRVPSQVVSIDNEMKDKIIKSMIGERTAKTKDRCVSELLKGGTELQEGWKLDFPERSGYVELENAVVLFVTMPVREGRGQSRSYPNEWLEEGSILSWFIRESDWDGGNSRLAQKMTSTDNGNTPIVMLFVRRGEGHFLCCGRCRVVSLNNPKENDQSQKWSIVKLFLMLIDWNKLQSSGDFQWLVNPIRARGGVL
jgi:hypothetical protein